MTAVVLIGTASATAQSPSPVPPQSMPAYDPNAAKSKSMPPYYPQDFPDKNEQNETYGSTYIPVDSWIYPAMERLYALGYADTLFLGMRPWTRQSVTHVLIRAETKIIDGNSEEAKQILVAVEHELRNEPRDGVTERGNVYGIESLYTRALPVEGPILRDSYHLGQTIVNDYGRPYQKGFNLIGGFSSIVEADRFSLYLRGEYQHAPAAQGYNDYIASALSQGAGPAMPGDGIPFSGHNLNQATIPAGAISAQNPFRLVEATFSAHVLRNEISFGKTDSWLGPAMGGSLAWSNNADNIYALRIDRVEPLRIPFLSSFLGPVRYTFSYGSLQGHTYPNSPYVHNEMVAFRPTSNLEIGLERTVIFGGHGDHAVDVASFGRSFFHTSESSGARYSDANFSYRLPLLRKYATVFGEMMIHGAVPPVSAPERAAFRTGLDLSQIPGIRKVEFRVEAASTDPSVKDSTGGRFNYWDTVQRQGYTNKGFILGDWMGREAKGGQAWLTYHFSGNEFLQFEYLNKKTSKDFIAGVYSPLSASYGMGGVTQNSFRIAAEKRFVRDAFALSAWFQQETWKAPLYYPGRQQDNVTAVQFAFFPGLRSKDY